MPGDGRYQFRDPRLGTVYEWDRNPNPDGEDPFGRTIPVTHTTTTSGQPIWQSGDPGPMVRSFKGRILKLTQFQQFWAWFKLSKSQTIYFTDAYGDEYEVQMTSFQPQLVGVAKNPRDNSNRVWDYTMQLTVYRAIAGDLAVIGVTGF